MIESTPVLSVRFAQPNVIELRLNRPEKLNAFNDDLKNDLASKVKEASEHDDVRVIVIRGEGRAFSVGADVTPRQVSSKDGQSGYGGARSAATDFQSLESSTVESFLQVWRAPVPVIAQVHGYCMGLGSILANCADIVICAEDTVVGWPRVPLGGGLISPSWVLLTNLHKAKELSYNVGSKMSGTEAAKIGFANHAFPLDQLEDAVQDMAAHIARVSKDLLQMKKAALNQTYSRLGFEDTLHAGAAWDALAHTTSIVKETKQRIENEGLRAVMEDWRPRREFNN